MIRWVDAPNSDHPFFLYAHLLRPHNPYHALPEHRGRFASSGHGLPTGGTMELLRIGQAPSTPSAHRQQLIDLYDENLLSADALLGEIIEGLGPRLDETIVVVLSDHGESFGEHGKLLHGAQVFEEQIHIPLLIRFPSSMGIAPRRIANVAQHSDVMPTVLSVLGLTDRASATSGLDLLPPFTDTNSRIARRPVISHAIDSVSLRDAPLKLVVRTPLEPRPKHWLYHLERDLDFPRFSGPSEVADRPHSDDSFAKVRRAISRPGGSAEAVCRLKRNSPAS